jgi:hypothetical protein
MVPIDVGSKENKLISYRLRPTVSKMRRSAVIQCVAIYRLYVSL